MSSESMRPGLKQIIEAFNEDRPAMIRDIPTLLGALSQEVKEAMEATDKEELARELADILIFTYTIAQWAGVDIEEEAREKISFNHCRYPAKDFQEGDYWEIRKRIKHGKEYYATYRDFYSIEK